MSARHLVAWLPAFRLERCGWTADVVAALVGEVKGAARVVASTPAAREHGVVPGVTATEARALVPDVELLPVDEPGEREDRGALLRAAESLSDRVVFAWEDAVVAEVSGTASALGGEAAAGDAARALFSGLGHLVRVAIADDPLAAVALASGRAGDDVHVHLPGRPLGDVVLAALRPTDALRAAWRSVGLRTCADLAALPASSVAGRYGPEGHRLYRVARGEHVDLCRHLGVGGAVDVGTADEIRVSTALAGATTRGELLFALPGLLHLLVRRLAAAELAVVRLRVVLGFEGGARRVSSTRLGRPTTSVARLERAVRTRLDGMAVDRSGAGEGELPAVPIDELRLEVEEAAPEQGWQPGLTDRAETREPLPDLLSRLSDQLGPDALFRAAPADAWRPEAAWRPAEFPAPHWSPPSTPVSDDPVHEQEHREAPPLPPRPALLLPEPLRIEVEPTEAPARARLPLATLAPGESPRWLPVRRRAGPERLWGEWWTRSPLDREYWALELDGRGAWVFRDAAGAWWLHGWFD